MSDAFADQAAMSEFYAELLAEHGDSPRSVGWNTSHGQISGFMQLTGIDGLVSGCSVLDIGCGAGDLVRFLERADLQVDYTGWDICEPLVNEARSRHPGRAFALRDILEQPPDKTYDFVLCSGTLNLRLPNHEEWLTNMVDAMFAACSKGLAFNLLSLAYALDNPFSANHHRYYYANPGAALTLCTRLSRQSVVEHYGQPGSFSAFVYRRSLEPMQKLAALLDPGAEFGPAHDPIIELYEVYDFLPELIEYLETLTPSAELLLRIGRTAWAMRDEQGQQDALERALELDPNYASALVHLGVLHMEKARVREALPLLSRALELEPDNEFAQHWLERCRSST